MIPKKPLILRLDHGFQLKLLEKFGFGMSFIDWIKIFLNDQESCEINCKNTIFQTRKTCRQSDQVSVYLFILCLKILFTIV